MINNKFIIVFIIINCCLKSFGQQLIINKVDSLVIDASVYIENITVTDKITINDAQNNKLIYLDFDLKKLNEIIYEPKYSKLKISGFYDKIIVTGKKNILIKDTNLKNINSIKYKSKNGFFTNVIVGSVDNFVMLFQEENKIKSIRIKNFKIAEEKEIFQINYPKKFQFSYFNIDYSNDKIFLSNVTDPEIYVFNIWREEENKVFGNTPKNTDNFQYIDSSSGEIKKSIHNSLISTMYFSNFYLSNEKLFIRFLKLPINPSIMDEEFKFGFPKTCGNMYWLNWKPNIIQIYDENKKLINEYEVEFSQKFIGYHNGHVYSFYVDNGKTKIYKHKVISTANNSGIF